MHTISMSSRNCSTSDPDRLVLHLADKRDFFVSDKYITLSYPTYVKKY